MQKYNDVIHETLFPDLTPRQYEILSHYAAGRSTSELETIFACSRTAIEKHLYEIRYKFNCSKSGELRTIFNNRMFIFIVENLINTTKKTS